MIWLINLFSLLLLPWMAGKGTTTSTDILKLYYQAVAISNIADNAATSPLTNIWVSGHTADPGAGGDQLTNEIAYTSYGRVSVARTSGGWSVASGVASPVATIAFPAGTGGAGTMTHAMSGTAQTSNGKQIHRGTVTPNIVTGNGITPQLTTASTITET